MTVSIYTHWSQVPSAVRSSVHAQVVDLLRGEYPCRSVEALCGHAEAGGLGFVARVDGRDVDFLLVDIPREVA